MAWCAPARDFGKYIDLNLVNKYPGAYAEGLADLLLGVSEHKRVIHHLSLPRAFADITTTASQRGSINHRIKAAI
jgi:hypothetical protein